MMGIYTIVLQETLRKKTPRASCWMMEPYNLMKDQRCAQRLNGVIRLAKHVEYIQYVKDFVVKTNLTTWVTMLVSLAIPKRKKMSY